MTEYGLIETPALYVFGNLNFRGSSCPADNDPEQPALDFPTRVPNFNPVDDTETPLLFKDLAVGCRHCAMVMNNGQLLMFGSNARQQIHPHLPDECNSVQTVKLPIASKPISVACGDYFTLVCCSDGTIYSAGANDVGQLGHDEGRDTPLDQEGWRSVMLPVQAIAVFAAGRNSLTLCADGSVYSWGDPQSGLLGLGVPGDNEHRFPRPAQISWFTRQHVTLSGLSCGPSHALAWNEHEVFGWGDAGYGRIGLGLKVVSGFVWTPRRITLPPTEDGSSETIVAVAAGTRHTIIMCHRPTRPDQPMVYLCGTMSGGGCPFTSPVRYTQVPYYLVPSTLACGNDVAMCADVDGNLFTWGSMGSKFGTSTNAQDVSGSRGRSSPNWIRWMDGKCVRKGAYGGTFVVLVCDDSKWKPGESPPALETSTRDVMVPVELRYRNFTQRLSPDRFEKAVLSYFARVLGDANFARARFGEIPIATPLPQVERKRLRNKRGAHNLRVGSKVRIWMTDVYALGVVDTIDENGGAAMGKKRGHPSSVEIRWAREDWDPEFIQLCSEDETLNSENEARWQNMWFEE